MSISTPPYYKIDTVEDVKNAVKYIKGPWILKPNYEGSSSGVVLTFSEQELIRAFENLSKEYHQTLLCETYIPGREFNVSLLYDGDNTKIIGTVEIVRKGKGELKIFSAEDKYSDTCTKIPASLPQSIIERMQDDTKRLHQFIGCNDYSRADFRVSTSGQYYFLELTPLPNVDYESGFAKCCEYSKLKLGKVLEEILYNALKRYKKMQDY